MQTSLVCTLIKWLCQWERAWRNAPWLASDRWANREPPFPATPSDSHLFSSRSVWSLIVELGTACLLRWIRWSVMDMIQVWLVGNQTEFSSHCSGLLFPFENSCRCLPSDFSVQSIRPGSMLSLCAMASTVPCPRNDDVNVAEVCLENY